MSRAINDYIFNQNTNPFGITNFDSLKKEIDEKINEVEKVKLDKQSYDKNGFGVETMIKIQQKLKNQAQAQLEKDIQLKQGKGWQNVNR